GALRRARDPGCARHHRADARGGGHDRPAGCGGGGRGHTPAVRGHPLVPQPRPGRLPVGARCVRHARRCGHRDCRRRSHGRGPGPAGGARSGEAVAPGGARIRRTEDDLAGAGRAGRRTRFLRTVWFPIAEPAYVLPVVAALAWGAWLATAGHATIGQVTTVVLYMVQIIDPVDRLVSWLDELQVGTSSLARVVGIAKVPADRSATGEQPAGEDITATDVRYAYRTGQDV